MKKHFAYVVFLALSLLAAGAQDSKPLRVFIRAGNKTHGPGQHDHPRFLKDWTELLTKRGAEAKGKIGFPSAEELEGTDVLVMYSEEAGTIKPEDRENLAKFLKRGGGIVAIHDSVCGTDAQWFKTIIGGAWEHRHSKWYEGEVGEYFIDTEHPITRGVSNFDWKDEIYWDLHMMPEAKILASSFHTPFVIAPQMWVYEKENYRSFVCIPGHEYASFNLPHFRAILMRGIAWAGKRSNVDYLCTKEELGSLKYPAGGPTAPEKAAEKFAMHPDFDVKLVASEPLVEKVISLDWDAKGRLWVAETPEYPGGRTINKNDEMVALWVAKDAETVKTGDVENRKPKDRVSMLEDTDGDGRMDKKSVFADGLELITSLVFYKDGVIVNQAPDILWLRDKNGDGKCDMQSERVVLYTGFGTADTHAVINNLRRGMDGWIYSAIGYSAGNPRNAEGKNFGRVTAGVIRFKPDGSALEQVTSGSCNTWGFDFAADGEMFYTTATCGEHFLHIVMPEKAIARANTPGVRSSAVIPDHQKIFPSVKHTRPAYVQIDWVGQFTASAGCAIYTGGAWPEKFDNSHFCSETTMSLVHHEMLKPKGVTFTASKEPGREETEFIAGSDLWFRPIHTRVGPDGALYVVDFYNQAAIHNDTRGPKHGARNAAVRPDRDHHFARIWRVQHKQAKPTPPAKLTGNSKDWVAALDNPNGWVRMTAHQLLLDNNAADTAEELQKIVKSGKGYARIHALWLLNNFGKLDQPTLMAALNADDAGLRKNGFKALAEAESRNSNEEKAAVLRALNDNEGRTRLNALLALASFPADEAVAKAIVSAYPKFLDKHLEAAALGVTAKSPSMFLTAAFNQADGSLVEFARNVTRQLALQNDSAMVTRLVNLVATQPARGNVLKQPVLESLSANYKGDVAWNDDLKSSFLTLLNAKDQGLNGAVIPLIVRWDKSNSLAAEVKPIIAPLLSRVGDSSLPEEERAQLVANLVGVRTLEPKTVPTVAKILGSEASPNLQRRVLEILGNVASEEITTQLMTAYPKLPYELRDSALTQILKRGENALTFLNAVEKRTVDLTMLGPAGIHRLRTHPEKQVADRANKIIDAIRGPEEKQKDALIAQFAEAVEQTGNLENGKTLFTQNCATCHKFKGEGRDVAPDLTGMGAHGPHDLLVHIIDPNRVVEPNFLTVSIETKDELSYDGIIARENRSSVFLRNAAGDTEIQQNNIKRRTSTGLSLMPNGFEALGKEGLRDLIGYICADEKRFRILDLRPVFTADSTKGMFISREATNETIGFRRFGPAKVSEVPFDVINPVVSPSGNNVIVLKGGEGYAKTFPQKVEIKANVKANVLHFLSGVAGWGHPFPAEEKDTPVLKTTVKFADGKSEELVMKNGVEFADYIGKYDVPGSKEVEGLVRRGQIRYFSKPLRNSGTISSITLESFDNKVAPVIAAITAEQSDKPPVAAGAAPAVETEKKPDLKITAKTLIVGGGSSHNFDRWFNKEDRATLAKAFIDVDYTDQPNLIGSVVESLEVLYLSNNQPIADKKVREGIMNRAKNGKGLLLVHPALWYNWNDWPEYNRELIGGGARSHDKFQEFEVQVMNPDHPIMKGVPATFKITDELYHFVKDQAGPAIDVLAAGKNIATGKMYPVVWTTQAPGAKIVCITLGHDEKSHTLAPFQTILVNAHEWARGKTK